MNKTQSIERRVVNFETVNEVIGDVNRIQAADAEGNLQACGEWTPGEILTHLSAWIEYGYEGYPIDSPSWFVRQMLKLALGKILKKGMDPGLKIPGVEGGTVGQIKLNADAAVQRYLMALNRLQSSEPVKYPSPAFGAMSKEKRVKLNLRHAELHLSFLRYPK